MTSAYCCIYDTSIHSSMRPRAHTAHTRALTPTDGCVPDRAAARSRCRPHRQRDRAAGANRVRVGVLGNVAKADVADHVAVRCSAHRRTRTDARSQTHTRVREDTRAGTLAEARAHAQCKRVAAQRGMLQRVQRDVPRCVVPRLQRVGTRLPRVEVRGCTACKCAVATQVRGHVARAGAAVPLDAVARRLVRVVRTAVRTAVQRDAERNG
jgi:hypothetical protein